MQCKSNVLWTISRLFDTSWTPVETMLRCTLGAALFFFLQFTRLSSRLALSSPQEAQLDFSLAR